MKMGRFRGFSMKHRVNMLFRVFRRNRSTTGYYRLDRPSSCWKTKASSCLFNMTNYLKTKAKAICSSSSARNLGPKRIMSRGYTQFGHDPNGGKTESSDVPKGQLAVYVGQKDGDFQRVFVPVIYFNHPLFGQLLREAEEEFGYNHPGAITIPCRISEFEHVQTRIKQGRTPRKLLSWKRQASS
ncbi:OLC1v1002170C1 [Oldenlandia corymbosa var. corymbosa]|uniref:OLC1v1002170C1 n=1 Tax=Oldenlandia corymbosa var. corymbosa TaxID=529605 RepID=A0AAV1DAH1_OLDCO|nr:OLC1v1002170C1 [Oldenlandia corymbosa var. corymbosa]